MNRLIYTHGLSFLALINAVIAPLAINFNNPVFVRSGIIEYEKRVNMYAKLKKKAAKGLNITEESISDYEKKHLQFYKTKGILKFDISSSYYTNAENTVPDIGTTLREPWAVAQNIVRSDFKTDSVTTLRNVYGQDFLVKDKKNRILWKYTNEVREIAGYECKRANGLILDSIYVVAFYSEKIVLPGGPECFAGLPGMILGIAIPTENVSWFATSVKETVINGRPLEKPFNKKTPITWRKYIEILDKTIGSGVGGKESLIAFFIISVEKQHEHVLKLIGQVLLTLMLVSCGERTNKDQSNNEPHELTYKIQFSKNSKKNLSASFISSNIPYYYFAYGIKSIIPFDIENIQLGCYKKENFKLSKVYRKIILRADKKEVCFSESITTGTACVLL